MQLLTGFRDALRVHNDAVRLLVPTATMAQHLQNQFAREGFVFRRSLIQTLSAFVENWTADLPQVPGAVLYLIVEEAARRVNRPEFSRAVDTPGFCASLARTIEEFASAGCGSGRLASALPATPLGGAFLAVYREVDRELERRGIAMRGQRLERAAERIAAQGTGGIAAIWLHGFYALPDPETRVIEALRRHAEITVSLDQTGAPAIAIMRAPGIEREAEEIARRILDQAAAGRPFREMGIVVRSAGAYVPVLRSTLERFGIPARFYFDEPLEEHATVRFLAGAVDAMLGGWDHAQALAVLRLAPRYADSAAMDRVDFTVREQLPNAGLDELNPLLADPIDELAAIEAWRPLMLRPVEWAARFRTLRNLFHPARPGDDADHELALIYRSQAVALNLFDEALDEAAMALGGAGIQPAVSIDAFWRAAKSVIRLKPLRLPDGRRNVVHVLSAPEARQWVLPVVFVCGMVEKQFPQFHRQDPFFPDAARCRLNAAGIRVRTAEEFEREERALFDAAVTRATMLVTLSYPEFDARGERNLPSLFLEGIHLKPEESRAVRPQARRAAGPRPPTPIQSPALLNVLREKTAKLSPSALESYLQCAFQYFGRQTLRLRPAPKRPEERLDFLLQGTIVHEVLAAWYAEPRDIEPLFENVFAGKCAELRIPNAYHTERLRNGMLDDLRAFAADTEWQREGFQSRMEEKFLFPLDETLEISGKIDRIDTAADGAGYVIDYKYSSQSAKGRLKDENLLQAPLYLMAAERVLGVKPAGMFYVGVKAGVEYAGWSDSGLLKSLPFPEGWLESARIRTLRAMEQIRAGRIEAAPADPGKCRFCDYRDVCRVAVRRAAEVAEGA